MHSLRHHLSVVNSSHLIAGYEPKQLWITADGVVSTELITLSRQNHGHIFGDLRWERETRDEIHRQWCDCALLRDVQKSHIRRVDVFWYHVDTAGVNLLCNDVEIFVAIFVHSLWPAVMVLHETGYDNRGTITWIELQCTHVQHKKLKVQSGNHAIMLKSSLQLQLRRTLKLLLLSNCGTRPRGTTRVNSFPCLVSQRNAFMYSEIRKLGTSFKSKQLILPIIWSSTIRTFGQQLYLTGASLTTTTY